jgi:hypothetical protein
MGMSRWTAVLVSLTALVASATAQSLPTLGPLDKSGRVPYFIEEGETGSSYAPADRELATWAFKAWERALGGGVTFEPAPKEQALVVVHWVPAGGGQYGEMRSVRVGDRRGAAVYIRPDTNSLGPDIAEATGRDPLLRDTVVYLTCVHEIGHALGLPHTADFADIMYFFGYGGDIPGFFTRYRTRLRNRADIATVSGLSQADIARVRALYPAR